MKEEIVLTVRKCPKSVRKWENGTKKASHWDAFKLGKRRKINVSEAGATGFEPTTSATRTLRPTKLGHAPL